MNAILTLTNPHPDNMIINTKILITDLDNLPVGVFCENWGKTWGK
jgi:hypothetical protein